MTILKGFIAFVGWVNAFGVGIAAILALFAAYHHAWVMMGVQVLAMMFFGLISAICLHPRAKPYHERWWKS